MPRIRDVAEIHCHNILGLDVGSMVMVVNVHSGFIPVIGPHDFERQGEGTSSLHNQIHL